MSNKTACVTGGTGFIAAALVKHLLENGYVVHATTRNPEDKANIAPLMALRSIGDVKIFRADMVDEGSFNEAVHGCNYVFHVAVPNGGLNTDDTEELIKSTVEGTLNVLRSCTKAKSTVKRVIYTSSTAAVSVNNHLQEAGNFVVDEESWSDVDFLTTTRPPSWGYLVAKTLAEKEAWKFAEENDLDLVAIQPVMVVGSCSHLTAKPPFGVRLPLAFLTGDEFPVDSLKTMQKLSGCISIVHLDDVCRAHLFLAETDSISGRYIITMVNTCLRDLSRFLRNRYPHYYNSNIKPDDVAEEPKLALSSEKLVKAGFRFNYQNIEDIYDDVVEYGKNVGMLRPNIAMSSAQISA